MNVRGSATTRERLYHETQRVVVADEAREYLEAPITPEERAATLTLVTWFCRRYPTPADRLAYLRRAYARWAAGLGTFLLLVLGAAGLRLAAGDQQRSHQPWPPPVQKVKPESPALSPQEEMKTFFMPPGYHVELVASEPMVRDPIWMDIDADGRMWVIEMLGFMPPGQRVTPRESVSRIVVLEDTNDDGKMDRSTVFMDKLMLPRTVKVLDHGVLVAEPPNLWLVRDVDGDLKADTKELVRDDFGRAQGNLEHNANSLLWGLDNWMYTSEHDYQLRLKNDTFEVQKVSVRGQWGVTMDDFGRIFRNWNEQPLFADLLPGRYYARNPNLVRTRGLYELLVPDQDATVWPVRPTPGINRGYREELRRPDGTVNTYTAAGAPVIYRGDRLPPELRGNAFVTDSSSNLVHRFVLEDQNDGTVRARNAYERGEFLASTDERFRPVNLYSGPDGTLFVIDMYRGVVQEGQYQTDYLRAYIAEHKLETPVGLGRIWRIVHDSTRRDRKPALSKETPARFVELLSHPNGWWRDAAQRLLVERHEQSVTAQLKELATTAADERTRLHALWTLDGIDAIDAETVRSALASASAHIRAAAVRIAERWLSDPQSSIQAAVLDRIKDTSPAVRWQLAASAGLLQPEQRVAFAAAFLEQHGGEPIAVDAALSGLQGHEPTVLSRLLQATTEGTHGPAMEMLSATIVKSGDDAGVQNVFASAVDENRASWQRLQLLRGVEYALSGMPPGTARGGGGGGRGSTTVKVTVNREPTALVTLSNAGRGTLSETAARVVARIDWPGKPAPPASASPDARPLTAEEEKRFVDGQEIYRTLCIACHQAEGQGLEQVAPPLAGSKWVTGPAGYAARIVLHGKDGPAGLMPPLGPTLNNNQIAAVLTYIRRSWGHAASPVDPYLVQEIRGTNYSRNRPWTDEELSKIPNPNGPGRGGGQ
jgi:mono/diheme cytochrome c family protein/glucose/arabinose dehydrogenase